MPSFKALISFQLKLVYRSLSRATQRNEAAQKLLTGKVRHQRGLKSPFGLISFSFSQLPIRVNVFKLILGMQAKEVQTLNMAKTEGIKRKLKPVIEKKRRDRINHNLDALRDLLFKTTADSRLQNPKVEKAEILDLAVQYIRQSTRKVETKVTSNQMDSKVTKTQSVTSVSAGPIYTTDVQAYGSDFCGRLNPSEQKEAFPRLGGSLGNNVTCSSRKRNEPAQTGVSQAKIVLSPSGQNYHHELLLHPESSLYGSKPSSLQYNSPPSSPTFNSVSSSPGNSPYPSSSCLLPLTKTPLSLHRPVIMPQPCLPQMARDFTPPTSPVLPLRQELFPLPAQSTWRPWS